MSALTHHSVISPKYALALERFERSITRRGPTRDVDRWALELAFEVLQAARCYKDSGLTRNR